jgi:hypothetical protein
MSGASSLFTDDFFRLAERRLKEGGIFLQWLQLYELAPSNIQALFRTFHSVFDQVLVFTPSARSNDTLVVGSKRPLTLDRRRVEAALADARLGPELRRASINEPEDFIGLFLLGSEEFFKFAGSGPINSDDNALIEFSAPKDLLEYSTKDAELPFLQEVEGKRAELGMKYLVHYDFGSPDKLAESAWRLMRQGRIEDATTFTARARRRLEAAGTSTTPSEAEKHQILERLDRADAIADRLTEQDRETVVVVNEATKKDTHYAQAVATMLQGHDREALHILDAEDGFEKRSSGHRFLYAYLAYRLERELDAEFLMEGVLQDNEFVERVPSALYYAGRIQAMRGHYDQAVESLDRFLSKTATITAKVISRQSSVLSTDH